MKEWIKEYRDVAATIIAILALGTVFIWYVSALMIDVEQKSVRCSTISGAKYGGGKCFKDGREI